MTSTWCPPSPSWYVRARLGASPPVISTFPSLRRDLASTSLPLPATLRSPQVGYKHAGVPIKLDVSKSAKDMFEEENVNPLKGLIDLLAPHVMFQIGPVCYVVSHVPQSFVTLPTSFLRILWPVLRLALPPLG